MAEATRDDGERVLPPKRARPWPKPLLAAATTAAFLVAAAIGAVENARGERVLAALAPLVEVMRSRGPDSLRRLLASRHELGWIVAALAAALALASLLGRGRRASIAFLAAAAGFATWGQILLLDDRRVAGAFLYGLAIASGVALGFMRPIASLSDFPAFPGLAGPHRPERSTWSYGECALVFGLTVLALLLRATMLTELPSGFDLETIASMIQSRTAHGIRQYYDLTFLTTAPGVAHIFTQRLMFALFGTSAYSIRLASLAWGVAAIPLFYGLMRRLAGITPAMLTTLLFAAAPEQLFWSRTENAFFAPVTVAALLTGHLSLSLVERFSVRATLAAALWMPFCRYFYTPAFILFTFPLAGLAHALLFARRTWRKAWYLVPLLAGGAALWVYSLSLVRTALNGGRWQFVDPWVVYGAAAWRKHGEGAFRQADFGKLVRLQLELFATNMQEVIEGVTIHGPRMFSHWFERMHFLPEHSLLLNVALTVTLVVGLAYLLGQLNDRRAFALLAWIALGLLPGVMSNEPSGRRIAVIFPAVWATAGVMLAAAVRVVRAELGRTFAWPVAALLAGMGATIVWSSLVSHFTLHAGPLAFGEQVRFARPLFASSDMIFTDLEERAWRLVQAFGNLDSFLARRPCYQYVPPRDWLRGALGPECDFSDEIYSLTMPAAEVEALRGAFAPRRVSYILGQTSSGRERTALLEELYPTASVEKLPGKADWTSMVALTVEISDVEALGRPWLRLPLDVAERAHLERRLLADVLLASPSEGTSPDEGAGALVQGGLLLHSDGWYRFRLDPACAGASLSIGGRAGGELHPLLAGVHAFEIRVPDPGQCTAPQRILVSSYGEPEAPLPAKRLVQPRIASLPSARAPEAVTYAGEGPADAFATLRGRPEDMDLDGEGRLSVLMWESFQGWRVDRFSAQGQLERSWQPKLDADPTHVSMAVAADGTHFFLSGERILVTDGEGKESGGWKLPLFELPTEIALWPGDRLLAVFPNRHSVTLLSRSGELLAEFREFEGGPGRFSSPMAIAVEPGGHFLVLQYDGLALLFFQSPDEPWSPRFRSAFRVAFSKLPAESGGAAFDGESRILIPDRSVPAPLVYTLDGRRMLAAEAAADLGTRGFGAITAFDSRPEALYVLDQHRNTVWRIAR